MRRMVFLGALAFGCSNNALPVDNNGGSTAGTNGNTTAGSTTAGSTTNGNTTNGTTAGSNTTGSTTAGTTAGTNGSTTAGSNTTGSGPGGMCTTSCDCMSGLACFQNMCIKSPTGMMLYCCDSSSCPAGQFCQASDGSFAMCGSGANSTGMGGGCKTACDCPSGQACFMGGCVSPPQGALYCCDNGSCPSSGGFCQAQDGSFQQCGGGGSSGGSGGGGGRDAGVANMCMQIMCMSDSDCTNAGCMGGCTRRGTCR